jgi:hypothetical protein
MENSSQNTSLIARLLKSQATAQLRTLRKEIVADLEAAHREASRLTKDLNEVERELSTRGDEIPEPTTTTRSVMPLKKALRVVLRDGNGYLTPEQIMAELERRQMAPGGKSPRNTLNSRLWEMVRDNEIERTLPDGAGNVLAYRLRDLPGDAQRSLDEEEVPAM